LGPSDSVFSVELAALHYGDPKSVRFAYRLEGFDPDWIETDARNRVATYTRLAPGDYVLRARARAKNGGWSEHEATLAVHVLPPWWRTRVAVLGWIALGLGAIALGWLEVRRRTRVRIALLERETLLRESLTDALTGLHNRRFLTSYLEHEVPRSLREYEAKGAAAGAAGADLLFLLIDADHFKSVNDEYSHAVGDRVLAEIAKALRGQIRDSDLAIRLGGDEFLVVSRSLERRHAGAAADRIRAAVEAVGVAFAAQRGPASTVSIGYAAFPFLVHDPAALTWEQTLELADRALLLTKARRRNSSTGLLAGPGVAAPVLIEFLRGGREAALPEGVLVVTPETASAG
jgi:diguanylate cyclase (GGDEF)-like protein